MNLSHLLLTFLVMAPPAVKGSWLTDIWQTLMGDPCPERSHLVKKISGFKSRLEKSLIGQELVKEKFPLMIENHLTQEPKKPLVISMHGWTGGGKNFATQILVESLYENGFNNQHVHLFSGRLHFPRSTKESIEEYKVNLHNWIRGNVSNCEFSTFIFDEIDKVPAEVLEGIKPFLDYHSALNRVNYRKAIFIFISNVGGSVITKTYLQLWENGISRDRMEYKSFEPILRKTLFNAGGAFEQSSILEDHLVSLYLPFLPMEKNQVRVCIIREMIAQGVPTSERNIDLVMNSMEYFNDRLSVSGCKRVSDLVAMLKYEEYEERDEL